MVRVLVGLVVGLVAYLVLLVRAAFVHRRRRPSIPASDYGVRIHPLAAAEHRAARQLEHELLEAMDWPL